MTRLLQHPWRWLVLALAVGVSLAAIAPAPSQAPANLPIVNKATHQPYTEKIDDKAKFDMLPIPGGIYLMGSPAAEKDREAEEGPQHPVEIKPFWMAKLEVTWDEYDLFWSKRPGGPPPRPDTSKKPDKLADALTSPTPPYADPTFGHGGQDNAALGITHHAAMEYCRWLSQKTGKTYRLPTEAEWEWACRAGSTTAYSFGDDPGKLGEYAWFADNSEDQAKKVGKKKANPWGLHDIHGNVAEWCLDHYAKDFYAKFSADKLTLNPFNPPSENRYSYTARGGSWNDPAKTCRSAARRGSNKEWLKRDPQIPQSIWWMTDADWVGIRVICEVEPDPRFKGIRSKVTWWSD